MLQLFQNYVSNVAIECFTLLLIKHDAMLMIRDQDAMK
jgi:hypothetical protein